jgi:hypothetical protein
MSGPFEWTLTITCPRPKNRAVDDFHTRPEKVARIAVEWFGPDAGLLLTVRSVRFQYTGTGSLPDLNFWQARLATVLDCLYLSTRSASGECQLPYPTRAEVISVADQPRQAPPIEGDHVT